ncbi:MAG: replicative DNA helicase [Ignavibacteriae bacterium]|nr:replicative DNA helicase [Ignavibacteriota bacterium]MCB9242585.1 replicative DNA helicase [Ignavibacteriales bacterium]
MAKSTKKQTLELVDIPDENQDLGEGRIAPNALDLEENVIGAVMLDNMVMNEVLQILDSRHFYRPANGIIFQAMINLDAKKEPIDPNTLKEELRRMGKLDEIGGVEYIIDLSSAVSTSANADYYARIIFEKYILRYLINISSKIVNKCFDPTINTFTVLDEAEQKILDISESLSKKKIVSVKEEIEKLISELGDQRTNRSGIIGIPTGYVKLDELTVGLQKSELIIVAGRPSHGKTAFALNIARNAAVDHNKSIGLFSLEMSVRELILRLLAGEARVDGKLLKSGKSTPEDWNKVLNTYHKLKTNLYIDDSSELSILELRAKARRMKQDNDIDMIIVDYLQLVKGPDNAERRDLEVAYVSRGLKALAKELDIPVVACAQLNRGIEQRGKEKRPQLADLRESGAIEQDADVVMFVHRPIMGMKVDEHNPDHQELKRKAEIIIGKQRNGPTGDFELIFLNEYAKFENMHKSPRIDERSLSVDEEEDMPF